MRHGSLFSGIGGFDLAAQWMGWQNVFHCEWNPFGQRILKYYWPNAISYYDITKTDFTIHRGAIDILTGGFPCQPYSTAGKRLGKADERHLFPEMLRAIKEIKPRWVIGENVRGLVSWNGGMVFDEVCADLEGEGYEVIPFLIPAAGVNAPHRRDRIFFIAHARAGRDSGTPGQIQNKTEETHRAGSKSSPASGEQVQLSDKSSALLGDVAYSNCGRMQESILQHTDISSRPIGYNEKIAEKTISDGHTDGRESSAREERKSERGGMQQPAGMGSECDASYAENPRLQTCFTRQREEQPRRGDITMGAGQWDRFPTVSPLCSRNDGLSDRLDGITFSKWRNESIKGGGNAIVPQVVYQIFKAIEAYETQTI